jgi:hypothetical protein
MHCIHLGAVLGYRESFLAVSYCSGYSGDSNTDIDSAVDLKI